MNTDYIKVTAHSEWAFLLVMDGIKIDQIYLPRYDIDFYTIKRELGFPQRRGYFTFPEYKEYKEEDNQGVSAVL